MKKELKEKKDRERKIIGQRIHRAMIENSMQATELANSIGVSDSSVSFYISGKKKPSAETLNKICEVLDKSLSYFVDDIIDEEIIDNDKKNSSKNTPDEKKVMSESYNNVRFTCKEIDSDDFIHLDCIMAVKAGNDTLLIDKIDRKTKFYKQYLPQNEIVGMSDEQIKEKFKTVIVQGDSMYPEYFDGDELIIKKANGDIKDGKKYIVTIDNCVVVKKVFKDENSITLVSINDKNYPPKIFTKKDFESQHISIDFRVIKLLRDE